MGRERGRFFALATLYELGQAVPQFGELEDLPIQDLQEGFEVLAEGLLLQLAALQPGLHIPKLRLQILVPRLCLLDTGTEASWVL